MKKVGGGWPQGPGTRRERGRPGAGRGAFGVVKMVAREQAEQVRGTSPIELWQDEAPVLSHCTLE